MASPRALIRFFGLVAVVAFTAGTSNAGDPKVEVPANLRDAKIADLPTRVSVPISPDLSLVVGVPAHFWIQCPRNSTAHTCLDGDGITLQYVDNLAAGKTHSLLYVGAVALPDARAAEPLADRAKRGAADFLFSLPSKYDRVDWALKTDRSKVKLSQTTVKVDGKPMPAWRTSKYASGPARNFEAHSTPIFTGELVLLHVPETESLAYIVVDTKGSGIVLDKALEALSVAKTNAVNPSGALVQLNDIAMGKPAYPVRLAAFTSPSGFAPTQRSMRGKDELVYTEERLDEHGAATATYQIEQRDAGDDLSLEQEADITRALLGLSKTTAPESIDLATPGARALVFSYAATIGEKSRAARTAVIAMEDKLWHFTWYSFGSEVQAMADAAAFQVLLRGMQIAIR